MEFLLAMVALDKQRSNFTHLFGLDLLFEIISDAKRSATVKRLYGFDYKSFIALTARHDVFCSRDIVSLNGHIASLNGHIANLVQAVAERDGQVAMFAAERAKILNSNSWRVTKPLRSLRRALMPSAWRAKDVLGEFRGISKME